MGLEERQRDKPDQTGRIDFKILRWDMLPTADGQELNGMFEITDKQGQTQSVRVFMRKINSDASYTVFHHVSMSRFKTSFSCLLFGQKGQVDGDFRVDRVSRVTISGDGTIHREEPEVVKVRVADSDAGFTPEQSIERFIREHWDRGRE